jgi:hypothetical protein
MAQNIQALGAQGIYGTYTVNGGGGGNTQKVTHDSLDAARIGVGRTPTAEYPDGYLGTLRSRRDDRLLDSLKNREGQRAYQRGVHRGERIDPSDYFYPAGLDPKRGLRAQAKGMRQAPIVNLAPAPHLVNDGKANAMATVPVEIDEKRSAQLNHLRPSWR